MIDIKEYSFKLVLGKVYKKLDVAPSVGGGEPVSMSIDSLVEMFPGCFEKVYEYRKMGIKQIKSLN